MHLLEESSKYELFPKGHPQVLLLLKTTSSGMLHFVHTLSEEHVSQYLRVLLHNWHVPFTIV
jgi:hypothetical protein